MLGKKNKSGIVGINGPIGVHGESGITYIKSYNRRKKIINIYSLDIELGVLSGITGSSGISGVTGKVGTTGIVPIKITN